MTATPTCLARISRARSPRRWSATRSSRRAAGGSSYGSRPRTARCSGCTWACPAESWSTPTTRTRWDRFAIEFEDGGRLVLRDKRRLGRALLNPDFSHVGPDAAKVGRDEFRRLIGSGRTAVKARLLNQHAISGVGNLLADQALWQARISPQRLTSDLTTEDLDKLRRELRSAIRSAINKGGVHTGRFVHARRGVDRHEPGHCPRDGTAAQSRHRGRPHHLLVPGLPDLITSSKASDRPTLAVDPRQRRRLISDERRVAEPEAGSRGFQCSPGRPPIPSARSRPGAAPPARPPPARPA